MKCQTCSKCNDTGSVDTGQCTCGGIDIGVGIMHEPGCGKEQCSCQQEAPALEASQPWAKCRTCAWLNRAVSKCAAPDVRRVLCFADPVVQEGYEESAYLVRVEARRLHERRALAKVRAMIAREVGDDDR